MQRALAETTGGQGGPEQAAGRRRQEEKELESRKNEIMKQAADLESSARC